MSWELLLHHAPSPVEVLHDPISDARGVQLLIKRDDLLFLSAGEASYPAFSGNKWRKLKYNLLEARRLGFRQLLSFGGAYSNHIAALAAAGKLFGFHTIGVIRGEPHEPLNPTLAFAEACGMQLHYLDRTSFREKATMDWSHTGHPALGPPYILPEGGTNALALAGCAELGREIQQQCDPDFLGIACGTGGTLAGSAMGLSQKTRICGFPVLKGGSFLKEDIENLWRENHFENLPSWALYTDYHFGGYAKWNKDLLQFIQAFRHQHGIPLDPVYTGKICFGVFDLMQQGCFPRGSTVCIVHTGGLQGIP